MFHHSNRTMHTTPVAIYALGNIKFYADLSDFERISNNVISQCVVMQTKFWYLRTLKKNLFESVQPDKFE